MSRFIVKKSSSCTGRRKWPLINAVIAVEMFFSPAGVTSLKKNFPDFDQKEIKIGTFGSTTAQAVRDAGLRLDLEAPTVQAPSMTAALDMFIKENNK